MKLQTSHKGGFFMDRKEKNMIIMKFGGSSVGTGKRMLHVAKIIKEFSNSEDVVVVVSAIYKVTDKLIFIFEKYKSGKFDDAFEKLRELFDIHQIALKDLKLNKEHKLRLNKKLMGFFGDLIIYLTLRREFSLIDYDYVISFVEILSSYLFALSI